MQLWPIAHFTHSKIGPKGSEYLFLRVLTITSAIATISLMDEVSVIILGLFTYVTALVLTRGRLMWLYRVRTRNKGVLISVVTEYGLAGAIRFPTWEDFEEFLVDSNAYAEEERARMSKRVPDIFLDAYAEEERARTSKDVADILLDAFMEDRERGIRQVAEELKEEIEKLQSLGNEKITKELDRVKKLLNIV